MSPITNSEYEKAQEVIQAFEKRQQQLAYVKKELGYKLGQFNTFTFRVDKKRREILFAGLQEDKVKMAVARCSRGDKFDESIGKLIAVKKALGEDISEVVKLVEGEIMFIQLYPLSYATNYIGEWSNA